MEGMRKPRIRVRKSKKEFTPEERAKWNAYKRDYYRAHAAVIIKQNDRWRQNNREKVAQFQALYRRQRLASDPDWDRRAAFKKRYGLTLEQYDAMLAEQRHCCAICFGPPRGRHRFHVDHDHQTGRVRSLLCWRCNAVLGNVEEDTKLLHRMAAYLATHASLRTG